MPNAKLPANSGIQHQAFGIDRRRVKSALLLSVGLLVAQQTSGRPPQASASTDAGGVPSAVLNAEQRWAGAEALLPLAASKDPATARYALRALGRLEDPSLI